MKTKLLLSALLFSFNSLVFAQCPGTPDPGYTCIPDSVFEQYLIDNMIDTNTTPDGQVLTAAISSLTELDITNKGISDLTGIQDFTALERLIARYNNIMTVNLASNTALKHLDLYQNKLTGIDVMSNTNLEFLDVGSFSKNTYNNITDIDLHLNVVLDTLGVVNNKLTSLVLDDNAALTRLVCDGNTITSLDLSNNNNLDLISCSNNTGMTSLTLPPTAPLTRLDCYNSSGTTGNGQLSGTLDVSMYPDLQILWCYGNQFSGTLNLASNTKIENVDCGDNDLTDIMLPIDIGNFTRLICDGNNLTALNLANNHALTTVNCNGYYGNSISNLTLPNPSDIEFLNCSYNELNTLNVSALTNLGQLYCHHNTPLTAITFNNPYLQYLYCNNCPMLTTLNNTLSLIGLFEFGLWYCDLTSLDLTNSMVLQYLEPGGNANLTNLALPETPTLTALWAYETNLSSSGLDYSKNTELQYLDLGITNFTSIDVSMLPKLVTFWGNLNPQLTSLNLANKHNDILDYVRIEDNTGLTCIQVDDVAQAQAKPDWYEDNSSYYNTDCTLGLGEFDLASTSIYPNPTKDKFYIDLQLQANYTLSNVFGQEVKRGALVSGTNELDTQALASGLYLLKLETQEGSTTKKLIKE